MTDWLFYLDKLLKNIENYFQLKNDFKASKYNYKKCVNEAKRKHNTDILERKN